MSGKKSPYPDGRIPDRNPDGTPAVPWRSRWTEGVLPLWLVATAGGMAVLFVVGLFFYGSYTGVGSGSNLKSRQACQHWINLLAYSGNNSGEQKFKTALCLIRTL